MDQLSHRMPSSKHSHSSRGHDGNPYKKPKLSKPTPHNGQQMERPRHHSSKLKTKTEGRVNADAVKKDPSPLKRKPVIRESDSEDDTASPPTKKLLLKVKQEPLRTEKGPGNPLRKAHLHHAPLPPPTSVAVKLESRDGDDDIPLAQLKKKYLAASKSSDASKSSGPVVSKPTTDTSSRPTGTKRKKPDYDDSGDDEEFKPTKSKKHATAKSTASPKKSATSKSKKEDGVTAASPVKGGRKKKEEEREVWKWWEETPHPHGIKWVTLEHKGPYFPPPYEPVPESVRFYYDGKPMALTPQAEEPATFFAKMLDHDYTKKDVFCQNFFADWRKEMTAEEASVIKDWSKCDFSEMHRYFTERAEARKAMSKEEKKALKEENDQIQQEYGWCIIDGHKEKIGNFKIEPPGLFRGRGDHPKMGRIKRRIQPEEVTINIGADADIPKPPEGHRWKLVQHDNKVTWLASWTENIQGAFKYVMLNPTSRLKGEKDWMKYETARKLKGYADQIRAQYQEDWKSKEMKTRQRSVAVYFIDKLALRAGNEKDADETADTVGCCSLRVEHLTLHDKLDGKEYVVELDFLGKDSIRYYNMVQVERQVFKNLKLFMKGKEEGDDLFDRLATTTLNKHLSELMPGLTAKVFRTYNASKTLQEQLFELTDPDDPVPSKMLSYNRANRAVAILCNHQRAAPKNFSQQMTNLQTKIQSKEELILDTKKEIKALKKEVKATRDSKLTKKLESKQKRLGQLEEQLQKLEVQATDKEENKEIALGTSKLNYLDPRITVAWCKKWAVPVEKVYNRTQRDKFAWAIDMADEDFSF